MFTYKAKQQLCHIENDLIQMYRPQRKRLFPAEGKKTLAKIIGLVYGGDNLCRIFDGLSTPL